MAFHPFRSFQKHRRAWLASVTLLAMVTFIACGSGSLVGDVGGWVQKLLGAGKGTGRDTVATRLYGKKVTARELDDLKRRRRIANYYVELAAGEAQRSVIQDLRQAASNRNLFDELQQGELQRILQERDQRSLQMYLLRAAPSQFGRDTELEIRSGIRVGISTLTLLYNDLKEKKPEAARKVSDLLTVLTMDLWLLDHPKNELYFGGGVSIEDLFDFMIWLHQADKLGIVLTDADIKAAFNHETLNRFSPENAEAVTQALVQQFGRVTQEGLFQALGDEFRVRLAKAALLGTDSGPQSYAPGGEVNHEPVNITPYEFWTYYRHNRTAVKVAMQPVPVRDFLDQVKEQPEEQELKRLFNRYKEVLATPDRDRPGFKQPRRVQVEWVSGKADTPGRRKQAARIAELSQAVWRVTAGLVVPAPDGGLAPVAAEAAVQAVPAAYDLRLIGQYQSSRFDYELAPLTNPNFALGFYTSRVKPDNVAAAVGLAQAGPLAAALGYQASAYAHQQEYLKQQPAVVHEAATRIPFGVDLALSGTTGLPFSAAALSLYGSTEPQYLPYEAVKPLLQDRVQERMTRGLLLTALNQLKKDLDGHKGKPEEVIAKAVKEHELRNEKAAKPRDQFDIADDPNLQPLKEVYLREQRGDPNRRDTRARNFYALFFGGQKGTYRPQPLPTSTALDGPLDRPWWEAADEPFLYWRTADEPEFVPADYKTIRDQVLATWKFQKARELAKKEADRLDAEVKALKGKSDAGAGALPFLRDQAAKHPKWGPLFELDNVARLLEKPSFRVAAKQYEPYKVPETFIEYPRADTVDKLLSLTEPGDTLVLSDRPEATYYVTVLLRRSEPSEQEFYALYRQTPFLDSLRSRLAEERQREFRQAFIKQLRAEAGKVDDNGRLIDELPDDMRKQIEGRGSETEE